MSAGIKAAKFGVSRAYHMGDPGLFGSIGKFIGGVGKTVVGAASGFISGGPMGALGGALKGAGIIKAPTYAPQPVAPVSTGMMNIRAMPGTGYQNGPLGLSTTMGRGATTPTYQNGARAFPATKAEGPPGPGYHLNKGGYYRRSPAGSVVYVPPESVWVRNRRRNPLNPSALDRAMGRVTSAKNASKKLSRITIRKSCTCK